GNPRREAKNTIGKKESFRKSRGRDRVPLEVCVEILRQTPYGLKDPVEVEQRNEEESNGLAGCSPRVAVLNGRPRLVPEHDHEDSGAQHRNTRQTDKAKPHERGFRFHAHSSDNEQHSGNSKADAHGTQEETL